MNSMRKEFYDLYQQKLFPILENLENERKSKLKEFMFYEAIVIITALFLYFIINSFYTFSEISLEIFIAIFIPIIIYIFYKYNNGITSIIKEKCKPYLEKLYGGIKWGTTSINSEIIGRSGIFDYIKDRVIIFRDTFSGIYNNVTYSVAEIYIDKSSWYLAILVPSNKKVTARTIIQRKYDVVTETGKSKIADAIFYFILTIIFSIFAIMVFLHDGGIFCGIICTVLALGGIYAFINTLIESRFKQENVKLEDLDFDKNFTVQSENQVEARYLVTPAFMDRLLNLSTTFNADIECSFFDDNILFSIHSNKDLFELGSLFSPLTSSKKVNEFFNELSSIYKMIDYFKLDEKTGL